LTGLRPLTPDQVRRWVRHAQSSPLYTHLIEVIAGDDRLMKVLNRVEHTPRPNVLLAGVQYLMMRDGGGDLARHYPNLSDGDAHPSGVDGPFKRFVASHEDELIDIGRTRYTQTNECRRCAVLLPAIWETSLSRFHLIDVGTSAGLNLVLDRYRYRWDGLEWGPPDSPVVLRAGSRGRGLAPRDIEVLSRIGLDLNPIDPTDPDDRLWLEALIWPEHEERRCRLRAALELASTIEMRLVEGSALETLGPTLDGLAPGEPAVVMHSFALNQFSPAEKQQIEVILENAREGRPVHRISFEMVDKDDESAQLGVDDGCGPVLIGQGHHHGEWVELYALP
jgi:hypothetical protein